MLWLEKIHPLLTRQLDGYTTIPMQQLLLLVHESVVRRRKYRSHLRRNNKVQQERGDRANMTYLQQLPLYLLVHWEKWWLGNKFPGHWKELLVVASSSGAKILPVNVQDELSNQPTWFRHLWDISMTYQFHSCFISNICAISKFRWYSIGLECFYQI